MRRRMMKSKIHRATVTGADLDYVGSISLDTDLMKRADILEYEQVAVLDIDNGDRFETYAIAGEPGQVQLNGAAARLVEPGHKVIVITYADYDDAELAGFEPLVVQVDARRTGPLELTRARPARPGQRGGRPLGRGPGRGGRARRAGRRAVQGRPVPGHHPLGPGRGGRRAGRRPRLHRPPPGRHPRRRRRPVRRRRRARPGRRGPGRVHDLIALGAVFDLDAAGGLALAREGGHSVARVVHAGGAATGAEIERALVDAVRATAASVMERWFAVDLLVEDGRCRGVVALDPRGERHEVRATHTLLATGGAGQLFSVTTNPAEATGDGVAMALRAGVAVADVEFVQFHPTALHHPQMPRPLLSEALRGHGALLRDADGERFVDELQPRDVVSRAMAARMLAQGVEHLWLDATGLESFDERFPTIAADLAAAGLDPAVDWLPIAPAAHYCIGGVAHRPRRRLVAARPVGRRRGGVRRRPRRQPPGLQLPARGHGLRRPGGRGHRRRQGRLRGDRRHAPLELAARWPAESRRVSCSQIGDDVRQGPRADPARHDHRRRRGARRRARCDARRAGHARRRPTGSTCARCATWPPWAPPWWPRPSPGRRAGAATPAPTSPRPSPALARRFVHAHDRSPRWSPPPWPRTSARWATSPPPSCPSKATAEAVLVPRADGVLAGCAAAREAFRQVDPRIDVAWSAWDGDEVVGGDVGRHGRPAGWRRSSPPSAPPSTSCATCRASPPSPAATSTPPPAPAPASATPARPRPACGPWRRRRSGPAAA